MGTKSKGRSLLYGLSVAALLGLMPQTLHAGPVKFKPQLEQQKVNKEKRLMNISTRLDKVTVKLGKNPQNQRLQKVKARLLVRQQNVQKNLERINAKLLPLTTLATEVVNKPDNASVQEELGTLDTMAQGVVDEQSKEEATDQQGETADLQEADTVLASEPDEPAAVTQTVSQMPQAPEPAPMPAVQGPQKEPEGTQVPEPAPMPQTMPLEVQRAPEGVNTIEPTPMPVEKGVKRTEGATSSAPGAQVMPMQKTDAQMLGDLLTTMEGELDAIQKNPGPDADAKLKALDGQVRTIRFKFGVEFVTNKDLKDVGTRFMAFSRSLEAHKMGGKEKADEIITKGLDDMKVDLAQIQANPTPDMDARLGVLEQKLNAFTRQNVQAMGKTMISSAASLLNDIHKAQLGDGKLDKMIQGFEAELEDIQKDKDVPDYGKRLDDLGKKVQEVEMKSLGMATPEQKEKLDRLFLEARAPMKI